MARSDEGDLRHRAPVAVDRPAPRWASLARSASEVRAWAAAIVLLLATILFWIWLFTSAG